MQTKDADGMVISVVFDQTAPLIGGGGGGNSFPFNPITLKMAIAF